MKQFLILVALFSCCGFTAFAQPVTYTLKGTLGAESGENFVYRIVFTDSAGKIKGHSYTYYEKKEGADIKAAITGTIDRREKTISLRETEIVYNNGFYSMAVICMIKCKLKISMEGGKEVLTAGFKSENLNHTACDNGVLRFEDAAAIKAVFAEKDNSMSLPVAALPKKATPKIIVYDTAQRRPAAVKKDTTLRITDGLEQSFTWSSDTVKLSIWDGGKIDYDNVSIVFNDRVVLSKYVLGGEKKELRLALEKGIINTIMIFANNEGNEPPNTANILLKDGDKEYPVVAYNNIGKKAVIRIRKTAN